MGRVLDIALWFAMVMSGFVVVHGLFFGALPPIDAFAKMAGFVIGLKLLVTYLKWRAANIRKPS